MLRKKAKTARHTPSSELYKYSAIYQMCMHCSNIKLSDYLLSVEHRIFDKGNMHTLYVCPPTYILSVFEKISTSRRY